MHPQTALTRPLLLLLFLHLSPPGGRSHPLGGPGLASELPRIQKLLDHLRDTVSELQAEPVTLEPRQNGGHGPVEAGEAREAAPEGVLRPRPLQALWGLRSPKVIRDSGCFGRRLDRTASLSSLGCKGEPPP
ncbi:natriuretic peptides B [Trichechus manatus latirostris]|uniref:Natriuretic peptides B n=1 Tax=Trichechus manatus latirostris TaxID=127582 RepID=A0A2Y9FX02_TRIMA|nr:natriuretic peptides B [Trichechus manatus latirostris]